MTELIPLKHQIELSKEAIEIIKDNYIVYLNWEERTGKSITAILITENINIKSVLIVTKKGKPLNGWIDTLKNFPHKKIYKVINYHKIHLENRNRYDCIILDEAHNYISGYPKPSKIWTNTFRIVYGKPIIYLSATPHAQGKQLLYHQFALSKWSPWYNYSNFYNWFKKYGKLYKIKIRGKEVNQYDKANDQLIDLSSQHLFIYKTRQELGFPFEPEDKLHYIKLNDSTKDIYNKFITDKMNTICNNTVVADTVIKLRSLLHCIEGGTYILNTNAQLNNINIIKTVKEKIADAITFKYYFNLPASNEKINYILSIFGDKHNIAIMYNYIGEGIKLNKSFKNAEILQATTNAEGIDLMHIEHLIIYSQDFSTARHTQRRARQANKFRKTPIIVHYLLVKDAISEQVYKTVSKNKVNFVDSNFKRVKI